MRSIKVWIQGNKIHVGKRFSKREFKIIFLLLFCCFYAFKLTFCFHLYFLFLFFVDFVFSTFVSNAICQGNFDMVKMIVEVPSENYKEPLDWIYETGWHSRQKKSLTSAIRFWNYRFACFYVFMQSNRDFYFGFDICWFCFSDIEFPCDMKQIVGRTIWKWPNSGQKISQARAGRRL